MRLPARPLLEHLRIFQSRSAEETDAFLQGKRYRFDIGRRDVGELDARINGIYMPGAYVGYVQYGAASVALSPGPERTDYWIQLPLSGRLRAEIGRDDLGCDPRRAAIASPAHESCRLVSEPGSTRLQLALTKAAVDLQLEALLGRSPEMPVVFDPELDLSNGYGQNLARYVLMAVLDLEQAGPAGWGPMTASAFEQFIVSALLQGHGHNYAAELRRRTGPAATRDVKRAVDYIEANLDAPIVLLDIVRAAGVPGRTLFQHFRDFKGLTPMQYLRVARFRKVRQALLGAGPEHNVTQLAMSWGFTHPGRFAVEYRRRFGESPSATLRKASRLRS